jgi:hypothetical protein
MSSLKMRTAGLLAAALAPAALLASGCGTVSEIADGVEKGVNSVEVCQASIDLYNKHLKKIETASTTLTSAPQENAAAAITEYNKTVGTEFTALHTGLAEQIKKAEVPEVKTALTELDTQVAAIAAKPETFAADGAANAKKLDDIAVKVNGACNVQEKAEKK